MSYREELLEWMDGMAVQKPRLVQIEGRDVYIRELTVGEIDQQIADTADKKDKRGVARGACRLMCDPNGVRMLDPDNEEDITRMAKMPLRFLSAINKAAEEENAPAKN